MGLISDINTVKGKGEEWEEGTDRVIEIRRPVYLKCMPPNIYACDFLLFVLVNNRFIFIVP
jgi:hypothetical protein